jgi:hypothetical protein
MPVEHRNASAKLLSILALHEKAAERKLLSGATLRRRSVRYAPE